MQVLAKAPGFSCTPTKPTREHFLSKGTPPPLQLYAQVSHLGTQESPAAIGLFPSNLMDPFPPSQKGWVPEPRPCGLLGL